MHIKPNTDSIKDISFSKDSFHDLIILFPNQPIVMVACIDVLYDPSTITMFVSDFVDQVDHIKESGRTRITQSLCPS
jgi:hypothetical protein